MIGTRIAHYEVTAKLGEGGMGEVYQATDTKLNREVALKILPEQFATDSQRMGRFRREAEVLASLDHPNIAAIYGIERAGEMQVLVLQLVEGPTLADRIAEGPIAVDESLQIAVQIAEALESAHEKGIIHRDLKPANIKVGDDGRVKVLDFGLAKAGPAAPDSSADLTDSPTISMSATQEGVVLGTAAYMSPEQARGRTVDKRSDIWAFGAVLYETLTGRRAFEGADTAEVLASVLRAEPDWSLLSADLDWRVHEALRRCLHKNLRNRYHDIGDVRIDLESALGDREGTSAARPAATVWSTGSLLAWSAAAALVGAVLALVFVSNLNPSSPPAPRPVHFSFEVPATSDLQAMGGVFGRLAISPAGTAVAYVGARVEEEGGADEAVARQLYLRYFDRAAGEPVPGTEGAESPFFSPDGNWVGFVANGKLQKVSVEGGAPQAICDAWIVQGASWGPSGDIVFGGGISSGLMKVAASGGRPEPLTSPDLARGEVHHGLPDVLPDGRTVLFTVGTGTGSRLARLSLDTGEWHELLPYGGTPRYVSTGHVLFSEKGNIRLARFDPGTGRLGKEVLPALDEIGWESWAGLEVGYFDVSRQGDIVYLVGGRSTLETVPVWVDRRGAETVIDLERGFYVGPRISPDGRRFAVIRMDETGLGEIWVVNSDGGQAFPVANEGADYNPVWTQDGGSLLYTSNGDLFERPVDRNENRVEFMARAGYQIPFSWSEDGRYLAFVEMLSDGSRIWVKSRDEEPQPLLGSDFNSNSPGFAPGNGWIAYVSDESGQEEVYVRPFPGTARGVRVSEGGGSEPVWSRSGRELFYRRGSRMFAAPIEFGQDLQVGQPVGLWQGNYFSQARFANNYDVDSAGRFLMLRVPERRQAESVRVRVALDWLADLVAPVQ